MYMIPSPLPPQPANQQTKKAADGYTILIIYISCVKARK